MNTAAHDDRTAWSGRGDRGWVVLAAFLACWDAALLPWALAYLLGIRLPVLDLGPEVYAAWLGSPIVAAVVAGLATGSIVTVWLCSRFEGYRWVMAIAFAWVAFAAFAQSQAELGIVVTGALLARRIAVVVLLWMGRAAFSRS